MESLSTGLEQIREVESQFSINSVVITPSQIEANGRVGVILNNTKYDDVQLIRSLCTSINYAGVAKDIKRIPIRESVNLIRSLLQDGVDLDVVYRNGTPISFRKSTNSILPSFIVSKLQEMHPNRWNFWMVKDHNTLTDIRLVEATEAFDASTNDKWHYGLTITRHLEKAKEYDIRCAIFRKLCESGLIATKASYSFKDVNETNLIDSLQHMLSIMDPMWNRFKEGIDTTKSIVVRDAVNRFDNVSKLLQLNKLERTVVKSKLDADMNFYKFYNVLTEYAQTLLLPRRRSIEIKSTEMINQVNGVTKAAFYKALFT